MSLSVFAKAADPGRELKSRDLRYIQQLRKQKADIIMILINDEKQADMYKKIHRAKP